MFQDGLTHNAVIADSLPGLRWNVNLHAKINGGLAYDGRNLYAVTFGHELVVLDPRTGDVRWRARADDVLMSTPIVAGGRVFVGSGSNAILYERGGEVEWGRPQGNRVDAFFQRSGRLAWSYPTVGEAMPSPAYADGRLYFATGDNVATALIADTGALVWTHRLQGVATMSSAMIDDGSVFFVTTRGNARYQMPLRNHTVALRLSDGSLRWSAPYGNSDCTPTIAGGMVFVEGVLDGPRGKRAAVGTNDVVALDERTGALRWRYVSGTGFFTGVGTNMRGIPGTYASGVLYQPIEATSSVVAFRASDGRVLWTMRASAPVKMSPLAYRGKLYFGDTAGMFYVLNARSGAVESAIEYSQPFTSSPPAIVGATLFVANSNELRAIPLAEL